MSETTKNPGRDEFEKAVLKYLKESNAGSEKVGFGAFSVSSKQKGNEQLASALLEMKKAQTMDIFGGLNQVGKKLLKQVEELTEKSITGTAAEQATSLKQLEVFKKLLPLVEDGTDHQKVSKLALKDFIKKSEAGMKKNTTAFNKFVGMAKGLLPSAAGIASGISARSPLLGAVVNFALDKYQEKMDQKAETEAMNVKMMIDTFEEIAEAEAEAVRQAQEKRRREVEEKRDKVVEEVSETVEQIDETSAATLGTLKAILLTIERIRGGMFGEDEMSDYINELHEGIREGMVEQYKELVQATESGMTEAIEESGLVEALPSEEEKLEDAARMEEQNEILREVADNVKLNNKILETQAAREASGGGILGTLKDSVLGALGIGAAGGAAGGLLARFSGFFKFLKGFGKLIPGGAFLKGALGKLFSFPVQFVIALINGLRKGVQSFMSGAGFGTAIVEGIKGFANWLLVGMLDPILDFLSNNRILDPIFKRVGQVVDVVVGAFTGIWEGAKRIASTVVEFVNDPIGSMIELKDSVVSWFESAVSTAQEMLANPGQFFRTRFENFKEAMLKFFVSMIPDWIPTDALPGELGRIVQKYRYGSGASGSKARSRDPVFMDNIVDRSRAGLTDMMESWFGEAEKKVERVAATGASEGSSVIDDIIRREGGFVNDPNDRGGATNFGITQQTLSEFLGRNASVDDVRNLDEGTARQIYSQKYVKPFENVQGAGVREFLIDSGVNHGTGRAKQWQGEVEGMGEAEAMKYLVERRRKFYMDIVRNDPSQGKFLRGWMNRLSEFEKPEMYASNEARIEGVARADRQLSAQDKRPAASAPTMVANTVNQSNNSNSIVQKSAPVNPDPTFHRYAGAMA